MNLASLFLVFALISLSSAAQLAVPKDAVRSSALRVMEAVTAASSTNSSRQYNGDPCYIPDGPSVESCIAPRECMGPSGARCSEGDDFCVCVKVSLCSSSSQCTTGEQCVLIGDQSQTFQLCYSCEMVDLASDIDLSSQGLILEAVDDGASCSSSGPAPSPPTTNPQPAPEPAPATSSSVCIAAKSLSHFKNNELVFDSHRSALVLCDHNGSCATHGHIVVHNAKPMMMSSYCKSVATKGCTETEMLVNSPRMRRSLRVPSNTDGLEFTALAARYQTKAEEQVLSTAVRIGL